MSENGKVSIGAKAEEDSQIKSFAHTQTIHSNAMPRTRSQTAVIESSEYDSEEED